MVVDDGSTDNSGEIIASFGDRIVSVLKENGGAGSAVNAGMPATRGEVIGLLDSDDLFAQTKVSRVVDAFSRTNACMVYHQLQMVDAELSPIGKPTPRAVFSGDLRDRVERAGGWLPIPVSSGLSFSRAYLERLPPIPFDPPRLGQDTYLASPAPFVAAVAGIRERLACNRVHGANKETRASVHAQNDPSVFPWRRDRIKFEFEVMMDTLKALDIDAEPALDDHLRFVQYSWVSGDIAFARALRTLLRCPTLPPSMKWREVVRWVLRHW